MPEIYELNTSGPQPFEAWALVMAAMVQPLAKETKQRGALYLSLCSRFIRERAVADPVWAGSPQPISPRYACRSEADIQRDMKPLDRRMRDRVTAGHMALYYLKATEMGDIELPPGARRLSNSALAESVLDDLGMSEVTNVSQRVWAPSLPVIHLCAAWATLAQEAVLRGEPAPHLIQAIQAEGVLRTLVERAALYEPMLEAGKLAIDPASLIRFRMASGGDHLIRDPVMLIGLAIWH